MQGMLSNHYHVKSELSARKKQYCSDSLFANQTVSVVSLSVKVTYTQD